MRALPDATPAFVLRDMQPRDHARVLELNAADVAVLSPLDTSSLEALLREADLARVAEVDGRVAGFVVALREGRTYASPNYRWFRERHPRFLYVDRVVVDERCRGLGIARALYAGVFERARARGAGIVACEYDIEPPNPGSARFHAAQGFVEVGTQRLGAGKAVSLQVAEASR